ncbi:Arf GTPase activating protein [Kalmanozyma brasiliensis GHG001]|uniref:Arf GTPase activating protein n=1 Tax=Kalmanozyma brasiliensis (strain GHG001) TaxID=1365824 RepID=UPI002867B5AD|nr:Arf GTPase activating protein [Kalmanozyma brasiliensis GHG001]KAF6767247.1 Arf GTPase activating protein [Kalmanozyma brasiliensis GHG001]
MSRPTQSRQQTEANAKILRALVKSPDNKVCVDCKKNDPRWASWNLGCFLCIRCSGIHRSMGTHISKVKSIDLDIWTPEQMHSVQVWGNRRCNLYWEAHLKAGHVPADHKIESFIRSKYESRRWAKDGPVPSDPSVLDAGEGASVAAPAASAAVETVAVKKVIAPKVDLFDDEPAAPAPAPVAAAVKAAPVPAAPAKPAAPAGGGIFDLDWHDPAPTSASATSPTTTGAKGKNDIMSLFAAKPAAPAPAPSTAGGNGFGDFGAFAAAPAAASNQGVAGLNAGFGSLDLSSTTSSKPAPPTAGFAGAGGNPWSTPAPTSSGGQGGLFDTQDVWGTSSNATAPAASSKPKENDAFADIWGDFK